MTTIRMICHKITEFPEVELYPISDLHIGSKEFDEAQFQKLSREILAQPNRYVMLAGDLVDNGIKSSVSSPYDAVMQPAAQRQYAAEILQPLQSRILAMCSGNHEYRSRKDTDTDPAELIAERLGIVELFRPDIAFIKMDLGKRESGNIRSPKYCIALTHGAGGGMMLGAGLSKSEPFAQALGVDLLISGHSHKPATAPSTRFECDMAKGVMVSREIRVMVATGWLNWEGYPARKMMKPVTIRPNKAILSADRFDIAVLS
jgi:predicted phosphodiesterase